MAVLIANPDNATTLAATAANVPVLANDTIDGSPVALGDLTGPPTVTISPAYGTATPNPDGTITYTPPAGFCGQVVFEYQIEAPDAECLCVFFGESTSIIYGVPAAFSTAERIILTSPPGTQCQSYVYAPSGNGWVEEGSGPCDGNRLYFNAGDAVVITQGELSVPIQVCSVNGSWVTATWGAPGGPPEWELENSYAPAGTDVTLTLAGVAYDGVVDSFGLIVWTTEPPIPYPASPSEPDVIVTEGLTIAGNNYCGAIRSVRGA